MIPTRRSWMSVARISSPQLLDLALRTTAEELGISKTTVNKILKRYRVEQRAKTTEKVES